jgi:hypothetical protein
MNFEHSVRFEAALIRGTVRLVSVDHVAAEGFVMGSGDNTPDHRT